MYRGVQSECGDGWAVSEVSLARMRFDSAKLKHGSALSLLGFSGRATTLFYQQQSTRAQ